MARLSLPAGSLFTCLADLLREGDELEAALLLAKITHLPHPIG